MLGKQPELNDSVAAVHPVILNSETKKKNSFSLGGPVSDHHHNMLDQLNQVDTLLPTSSREVAMAMPQEPIVGHQVPMYEAEVHDSENDDDYLCYYSGAFVLGGDTKKEFAKHHWMIDSGCTDHLTPFKDNFAHLETSVQSASIADGSRVPMYGPGKVILQQSFKGSEPVVLEEVWYAPYAVLRLLSVNTLTSQGYKCVIKDQESRIWNANGALVIRAIASSPKNNLHWFQSRLITPEVVSVF